MNGWLHTEPGAPRQEAYAKPAVRGENIQPSFHQELQTLSRRCLGGVSTFLLVSTGFFALRHYDLLGPLSASMREILGCPPPPVLTSLALAIYLFSQAVLTLGRTIGGIRPVLKWQQLVYRTVFFFFYSVAGALDDHFMAVFVAGLLLFGLDYLNIWAYSNKYCPTTAVTRR